MWSAPMKEWVKAARAALERTANGRTDKATKARKELEQRIEVAQARGERLASGAFADDLGAISGTEAGMKRNAWVVGVIGAFSNLVLAHAKTENLAIRKGPKTATPADAAAPAADEAAPAGSANTAGAGAASDANAGAAEAASATTAEAAKEATTTTTTSTVPSDNGKVPVPARSWSQQFEAAAKQDEADKTAATPPLPEIHEVGGNRGAKSGTSNGDTSSNSNDSSSSSGGNSGQQVEEGGPEAVVLAAAAGATPDDSADSAGAGAATTTGTASATTAGASWGTAPRATAPAPCRPACRPARR